MAETTTISLDEGSTPGSSPAVSLETAADAPSQGSATEDAATLRAQVEDLTRRNEQYLRERNGWQSQSQRNLDENRQLADRLARLEGHVQASASGRSEGTAPPVPTTLRPGQLKTALSKWINNDESDLDAVESVLSSLSAPRTEAPQFKPDDLRKIVRDELVELGTRSNLQTIVGNRHPDLANPQSDLSAAVWDAYDTYAADQANQLMFEPSERHRVPMIGPDGSQKLVDARLVDRLASDLRMAGSVQEGRRQESRAASLGSVSGGPGRATRSRASVVEAMDLLTPGEMALLQDPKIQKGWPALPKDPKAAAKYLYDGLSPGEKAKRLADYRARNGRGGT
jgi:hypothetical protein